MRLMRAEKTHYPAGARACLSLDTVTGINLGNSGSSAVWAPRTDLTAPTAHPFVFYAGPAQNVPDLAVDLARRGLLRRHDIMMTIDVVSDEIGPQARSEGGAYYHPDTVHHTFRQAPAVIYTTEPTSPLPLTQQPSLGAEEKVLNGARRSIERQSPVFLNS
ncbi:hypothetical protein [Acidomonas methanolica]|uniref:hypothetical protein n=1 Tax=Acidomonas methanolica TaxID=437 RepID=UPI00211A8BDF|nr:hypothetical protein [Acidomonas methanolica]MCQ9157048.1 hypothetical protein [Acidomonas methanolica]